MKLIASLMIGACTLMGCNATKNAAMNKEPNTLTSAQQADGWRLLFDGSSTAGWHTYGKQTVGKAWKAEDGTLRLDASSKKDWQTAEGGDIVTGEEFDNFHLKLDWKIAANGNSGVIFYVNESPAQHQYTWSSGMEMQVLDNAGHPDAKIIKHRAGDLYDLITAKETVRPAGEWNHAEIISNKGDLQFFLNGEQVLHTTLWNDAWKQLVAGSKFKNMPGFGTFRKGRIALQDHGDNVWYRNVMIRKL
jgi:hypothetical protein